ncbi:hypothetical protein TYRP_009733, partial [Tyrophagus putrescentiae]
DVNVVSRHALFSFSKILSIDWCHFVDQHRPTARDATRKLVVSQAVFADQPNDTSLQHLEFTWLVNLQNVCKKFCSVSLGKSIIKMPKIPLIMSSLMTKSTSDHVLVDDQKYL